jgi:hypothetical protein
VTWGYSIDTTAGPITFSTSTGLLSIESSDVSDDGVHNYVISVTLTEVSSSTLFQTLTYNLAVTASYTPSSVFQGTLQSLATTYTYYVLSGEELVETYAIDCQNLLTSSACGATEVNYVLSIDDAGISSSSTPTKYSTSNGELRVISSDLDNLGTENYVLTVKMYDK